MMTRKPPADPIMSLTTPTMTWELESACHVMCGELGALGKPKLGRHLDQKYGVGKWRFCGTGRTAHVDDRNADNQSLDRMACV